jgi:predicted phosphodiesterase
MVYGLISDIHGNAEALEAVLSELEGVEGFLCLGDIVGYGADPSACLERVRELRNLTCIAGNHDRAAIGRYDLNWFNPLARAAIEWTGQQLTPEEQGYLASLSLRESIEDAKAVHGSFPEPMGYIMTRQEARECFDAVLGPLVFVGHTHVAEYYRVLHDTQLPEQVSLFSGGQISLEPQVRYIVNPGAIGQPRDGNPAASFGVWDPGARTVETRRVSYDLERAQEKMRRAGLPDYLIARLGSGR